MKKFLLTLILSLILASTGYSQVTTLWEKSGAAGTKPTWEAASTTRGLSYGFVDGQDLLFVVNRTGGSYIYYFDATTGDSLGFLNTTGIAGGLFLVNDVGVSSDGKIFVCNMTTDASAAANPFKVYRYDSLDAAPVAVVSYNSTIVDRFGDKFTVTGSTADNSVTIWAPSAVVGGSLQKFTTIDNGFNFTNISIPLAATTSSAAVAVLPNGDFYFDTHGGVPGNPTRYSADGTVGAQIPGTVVSSSGSALGYLTTILGDEYIVANELLTTTNNAKIIKVVNGDPASAVSFATTSLLGSVSAGGLGDVSVQKVNEYVYNIYPLATNNGFGAYQVDLRTPLAGDYFIPQGTNPKGFPTLGDAVASLNINGASGTVNLLLDADTLRENTFTFNADLSVDNNVVIKPASGRDVVLFVTAGTSKGNGIQMIGFDKGFVTFDGSNNGTASRNLIISTEQDAVAVPFGLNTANADTITLKNLVIKNIVDVPLNFRYGAVINDVGGVWGFRVENCQIGTPEKPVRRDGLAPWGGGATSNNFVFLNNEIYAGVRGVTTIYLQDCIISGNTINIIPTTATGGSDAYNHGMYITGAQGGLDITENTINLLNPATITTSYLIGIAFAGNDEGGESWINIFNNIINVGAASETRPVYGIGLRSSLPMGNLKVYYNTIVINENASTLTSYAIGNHTNGTGSVNIDLKNNILVNKHTGNVGSSALGLIPTTSVLVSNYNDLYSAQNLVNMGGTLYADLSAWQTASGQDANSVSKQVFFVSADDLHLTGTSIGDKDLTGTPLAEVSVDIDGDARSEFFPYMGADEGAIALPVELTSFSASIVDGNVQLTWKTATELNNKGFDVQKKIGNEFETIGFVPGRGTSSTPASYSFIDNNSGSGKFIYRLKQIDLNGSYSYSGTVEVDMEIALTYDLNQNYPNPFNPSTTIKFQIAEPVSVTLAIYNTLGAEVAVLIDNQLTEKGQHSIQFDASKLASGTYIYRLTAGNYVQSKKMILMK